MNDIYLKFAMKPMMIERRSFEWLAAHMASNKALKFTKPSLAHGSSNNIAIIPIHGILTKRSGIFDGMLGMTSYDEIQQQISAALLDDAVQTILLDIDSPGGETSGLFDLADFIYQARSQKTIWAVCNDEAYSAAYGIASSAEKVFINRTSGVGSIGVIASHMDQSAFDEKQGVKYTTVFAGNRKNDLNPHEPLTSESMQTLQSEVSRLYEMNLLQKFSSVCDFLLKLPIDREKGDGHGGREAVVCGSVHGAKARDGFGQTVHVDSVGAVALPN